MIWLLTIILLLVPATGQCVDAWTYPGIPYPTTANATLTSTTGFSAWPYDPMTVTYSTPAEWPSGESTGKYYIDNSPGSGCSDSNTYGHPSVPRCNLPASAVFSAGTVIEVHGGPYDVSSVDYEFNCSSGSPCFLITPDNAEINITATVFTRVFDVRDSDHLIVDGFIFDGSNMTSPFPAKSPGIIVGAGGTYITIRNCTIQNIPEPTTCCSAIMAPGLDYTMSYNNTFSNIGTIPRNYETGQQLQTYDYNGDHHWVINNTATAAGEDFVHIGPTAAADETNRAKAIFVAGNTVNGTQENAVDVKKAQHVIISSNVFHNFKQGSPPNGIVVNNEEYSDQVWIINNIVYDSGGGISLQPVMSVVDHDSKVYVIGNVVYDCDDFGIGYGGAWGSTYGADVWIINNTVDDSDVGISLGNPSAASTITAFGNIATNATTSELDAIDDDAATLTSTDNLIYRDGGTATVGADWPAGGHTTGDPGYVNSAARNYQLLNTGAAFDAQSAAAAAFATFESLYGLSITEDVSGTDRPQGAAWDIGAYEYTPPGRKYALTLGGD